MSVYFNGRQIVSPATASVVNDDAMRNQNLSVGNVLAIVGRSSAGQPKTPLRFGSPQEAQKALVSGELLEAVLAAFDPSAQTGGPALVVAVRVNPATQATGTIKAGATDQINLVSTNYGAGQNQIKYKVEAGSVDGVRVTVQQGQAYYTQDNLARRAFSIQYTGALASADMTINDTTLVLNAPSGTPVATIALAEYPTVADLVDRINTVAGFTASVLDRSGNTATAAALDHIAAPQDVKTAAYTVRADLQAVVDWLNSAGEGFLNATRIAGVGTKPSVAGWQFLSGGSDGVTTNSDWSDAFEALQAVDAQFVVPVSGDAAIHAMADTHVAFMSGTGLKERRAICGTAAGTTDAQAIAAARALNSDRTSLVHLGHYNYDLSGKLVLFPPYISAAIIGGMFAGVNPGTPLTNKTIKVRGLERNLRNPTDTDELIKGGVLCLESTEQGYKVVQSISTWLVNDNYNRVEQSTGVAMDFVSRNVRQAVDALRGQKANPLVLSRAISITESVLRELSRSEPQGPGVLAGDDANPAYRNIKASLEGDVLRIEFECSPVIPVNYVLATIYAVPFTGSATA